MTKFWEVYDIIKENNYGLESASKEDIVNGAISGMVEGIGDPFTEYLSPTQTKQFIDTLSGDFEGIGAVVEKHELGVLIDMVLKGSPAKKYGIKKGDIILTANTHKLQSLSLYEAINYIKGPAGTQVILEVLRSGEDDILEIDVTREKIQIPSVESEKMNESIGYISLNMFGEDTAEEFEKALSELGDTDGIILDLRDNGGGYMVSAVEILSNFIDKGEKLVSTKQKNTFFNRSYQSVGFHERYSGKIVVLINENSASASEITAGALREYNKAILLGTKTYGKGSVQQPFEMKDGSLLKLTIAEWLTPKGNNINLEGIEPDIEVVFEKQDYENEYDRQREVATEVIQEFIRIGSIGLTVEKFLEK
ncbi:S41 family peptidase [Candidatus Gracilibacteria bacterium]|nr:S41 family peptidase [Candidatus Gracilibacteria bacterium]